MAANEIRLEGTFDSNAAVELLRTLATCEGLDPPIVDFSRVCAFRDSALAVLAQQPLDRPFQLRGLSDHQQRLFGYMRLGGPSARRSAYYIPEDASSL